MKNYYLTEALYLEDFDSCLEAIFDQPLAQQPRFIVEIGCGDGYLLKHAYDHIKTATLRGKNLEENPLEVVPLIQHENAVESVRRKLEGVPSRTSLLSNSVLEALKSVGIDDPKSCLFIDAFPENPDSALEISTPHGVLQLQVHQQSSPNTAEEYLEKIEKLGLTPIDNRSFSYPGMDDFIQFTLNHFLSEKSVVEEEQADWSYEIAWRQSEAPEPQQLPYDRVWLIFADREEKIAHHLREQLREQRQYCVLVQQGSAFQKLSEESFIVNPQSSEDFQQLIDSISNISQLAGVVYLWSHISEKIETFEYSSMQSWHEKVLSGLIFSVNALDELSLSLKPRFWIISESTSSDGSVNALYQWPISSLSKVITEESFNLSACYLCIESEDQIYSEITAKPDLETQVVWRGGNRLVPRMVPCALEKKERPKFSSDATYIVATGFSTLGLIMARWYVDHGVKNLLLLDEQGPSVDAQEKIEEMRDLGCNVMEQVIRFEDESEYQKLLKKEMPPIKGIVHTVTLLDDELLRHTSWETFKVTYRMRIASSWHLHQITESLDLDHFILFSSLIPHFAPSGKANQAVATSFLDALSYYRNRSGLPAISIDWGTWGIKQVIVKHLIETRQLRERLELFSIDDALEGIDNVLNIDKSSIILAKVKWPEVKQQMGNETSLFNEIPDA